MKHHLFIFVIFGVLSELCSEDLNEEDSGGLSLTTVSTEKVESDTHDQIVKSELSATQLSEIHGLAKNISHSKGIYREGDDGKSVRRSILNKAVVASESDIMKELLSTFDSQKNKLELLHEMEHLVHQYDVAISFATMGGMKIILPHLFSDDDEIASTVAIVLGSAMQSNPTVQKMAVDQNIGRNLLYLLAHPSPDVLCRVVFAVASLLRNSPEAQEEFISLNGFSKLADILENHYIQTNIKLKVVDLLSDLSTEQMTATENETGRSSEEIDTLRIMFFQEILKFDICKHITSFLNFEDFETHQKTVAAMLALDIVCHKHFKSEVIQQKLKKLINIYGNFKKYIVYPEVDEELRVILLDNLAYLYSRIKDDSKNASMYSTKVEL